MEGKAPVVAGELLRAVAALDLCAGRRVMNLG